MFEKINHRNEIYAILRKDRIIVYSFQNSQVRQMGFIWFEIKEIT